MEGPFGGWCLVSGVSGETGELGEGRFLQEFLCQVPVGWGSFLSQTGASRAQIGNRCVEGSEEGKGGNDGEKKGGKEKGRAPGDPGRYKPQNDQGRRGEGARIRREREKGRIKYDAEDEDLGRLNKENRKKGNRREA